MALDLADAPQAARTCAPVEPPAASVDRWGDLGKRAASAAVMAPLAMLCIWLGGAAWLALVGAASVGVGLEWAAICGFPARRWRGLFVPLAILCAAGTGLAQGAGAGLLVLLISCCAVWAAAQGSRAGGAAASLGAGVIYLGVAALALSLMRADPAVGRSNIGFLFIVVWASDIGGYVSGRLIGGPRLAPMISPGKTWSGAAGGLVSALMGGAAAVSVFAGPGHITGRLLLVAGLLGMAAQAGDLLESLFKRQFGVKDSGSLIPGHGGLLDRLDGLLAAATAAALLALTRGPGINLWQ